MFVQILPESYKNPRLSEPDMLLEACLGDWDQFKLVSELFKEGLIEFVIRAKAALEDHSMEKFQFALIGIEESASQMYCSGLLELIEQMKNECLLQQTGVKLDKLFQLFLIQYPLYCRELDRFIMTCTYDPVA